MPQAHKRTKVPAPTDFTAEELDQIYSLVVFTTGKNQLSAYELFMELRKQGILFKYWNSQRWRQSFAAWVKHHTRSKHASTST